MNLFETVKASVSVPDAAKMYGLRPNHHGMVRCPFHDDRFVEACQMLDHIEYLADILTVGDLELRTATVKDLMKDGTIGGLEEKIRRDCTKERGITEYQQSHIRDYEKIRETLLRFLWYNACVFRENKKAIS